MTTHYPIAILGAGLGGLTTARVLHVNGCVGHVHSLDHIRALPPAASLLPRTLVGTAEQDRVYSPDLFEPREGIDELLPAFWASSSRCLAIIGPAGVGKTSLLCRFTQSEAVARPVFFYDARMLVGGMPTHS